MATERHPSKTVTEVVGIGRDSRISGPDLTRVIYSGVIFGVRVIDFEWQFECFYGRTFEVTQIR